MKLHFTLLAIILILAFGLRFYKLNQIPYGPTWDEASIMYNSWGISLWNRDEYATKLPLSFKSFGDYKAPLTFYLLAIPYKLFGLNLDLLRIYSALSGCLLVVGVYLLSRQVAEELNLSLPQFSLIASFLVATNPWAIHMSRVGFEANLGVTMATFGIYFIWKFHKKLTGLIVGFAFLASSLYAYHSPKVVVPLLLISFYVVYRKNIRFTRSMIVGFGLFCVTLLPLLYNNLFQSGGTRANTTIFFQSGSIAPLPNILFNLIQNLINLCSLNFWIGGIDAVGLRHLVSGFGILYLVTFGFFIIGFIDCILERNPLTKLLLISLVVCFIPSLITPDNPHAIRSLLALPMIILITAKGVILPKKWLAPSKTFNQIYYLVFVGIIAINLIWYQQVYYSTYATQSATAFQYGYKEVFQLIKQYGKSKDKIIITNFYQQPYIYALLYQKITPQEYQFGALANFEFRAIKTLKDEPINTLLIGTPEEIPINDPHVITTIKIPNSEQIVWVIAST